jgi:hypothetical protein
MIRADQWKFRGFTRCGSPSCRLLAVTWLILFLFTALAANNPVRAQSETPPVEEPDEPSVDFSLFSVRNPVVGKRVSVDAAFAEKHGMDVPAPFSVIIPASHDFLTVAAFGPGGDTYMKISFATPDRQLIDNLRIVSMTAPLGEPENRLNMTAGLLAEQGFDLAVQGFADAERHTVRKIRVGRYDAVEVIGTYTDPALGPMFVRLVGIPNPESRFSVFAITNVVAQRTKIADGDDLTEKTRSGRALTTFRYLDPDQ